MEAEVIGLDLQKGFLKRVRAAYVGFFLLFSPASCLEYRFDG